MFWPLEAIIRSRFGFPGGGIKFKVANGTGRRRWRAEISTLHRPLPVPLATLNLIPPPGYPNLDLMMASRGRNT